tara:strand:+ start:286 stop:720 length:435 start_codon:yes stop_codon:yes gene_type:complete
MALPDQIKWETPTSRTSGISAETAANDAGLVGDEIDNETNLDKFCDIHLQYSFATSPTANKSLLLYLLRKVDGTNYEDGSASVQPLRNLVLAVSPPADTSTHHAVAERVPLPPHPIKALLWNDGTGQTVTATVTIKTYNHEQVE